MHSLSVYLHRVAFSFCFCLFNMTDTANLKAVVRRRTVSHTPPFGVEHPPKPHSGLPEGTDRTSKMRDVALPVLRATGPAPPRDAPGGNNTLCVPAPHIQPGPETGDATTSQANKSTGGAGHRADRVSWPLPAQTQRKGVRRRGAKTPRGHDVVTTPLPSARRSAMSSYHRGTAEVAAPPPKGGPATPSAPGPTSWPMSPPTSSTPGLPTSLASAAGMPASNIEWANVLQFLLDSARAAPTHTQATHTAMVDVDQTDLWSTDDCPPASDIRRYRQDGEGTYASGRLLPYLPPFVDHTTGLPHTAGSPDPVEMQMPLSSAQYNTSTVTSDFDPEVDTMGVDTPTIAKKPLGFLMATYPQFFSPSSQQPSTLGEVDRLLGVTQELSPLLWWFSPRLLLSYNGRPVTSGFSDLVSMPLPLSTSLQHAPYLWGTLILRRTYMGSLPHAFAYALRLQQPKIV